MEAGFFTPEDIHQIARWLPVLIVLGLILWAGHKGFWYWGQGVRAIVRSLEGERDKWRDLALALLKEKGVSVEGVPERPPLDLLPGQDGPRTTKSPGPL